ncbi:MAG: alpha-galactosidase [Planctomycetia bacterium]|nr:alpha-galactosidase [Planctomycetia bacterium]
MIHRRIAKTVALVSLVVSSTVMAVQPARADELAASIAKLPSRAEEAAAPAEGDWLVVPVRRKAGVYRGSCAQEIVMTNGLISRTWRLAPNAATVGFDNLISGESLVRGVKPEVRLQIDGKDYDVGGLQGQPDYAYLRPEWLDAMKADPGAFQLVGFEVGTTKERFAWKRVRHCQDLPWPPPGISLTLRFKAPAASNLGDLTVSVHYEMYDGIPLVSKWFTLTNASTRPVRLDQFVSEVLAVVEYESAVDARTQWMPPNLHVESDYEFCGMDPATANRVVHWVSDPEYSTQVNYDRKTPCLLECRLPQGPDATVEPGKTFESFRVFELVHDSSERERKGLAVRRMYRTIAPWVTENPILMHVSGSDPVSVKRAVDQCAEVGFEMVIMTFGSGFNVENEDPAYLKQIKEMVDYAHSKGVELGGYGLLSSRGDTGPANEVINPATGKSGGAIFGQAPCLGSPWGQDYFRKLYAFFPKTGLDLLEHDGSYPGDPCASTTHPGHRGLADSQWQQWKTISDFYKWCRARGVYLNVPDHYFLVGSTKTAMGYRETNWSLPRAQQIIHGRQNIFDGTWVKTPSMGWMFVPLVQYQGGGAAATIEPLSEHLADYEAHVANLFGAGVQACYRGPRLYDTDATKAVVKRWVDFYKQHRAILDSDIIHVRRADGRDIDCILHVNPRLKEKGLAMVYNPLERPVNRVLKLPLYYTGLTDTATVRREGGEAVKYKLDRDYSVEVPIEATAAGVTWIVVE